jgi:hypothetical protein
MSFLKGRGSLNKRNVMLRQRIENMERSIALEEVQRQEQMQDMPLKSVLKNAPRHVHYHSRGGYSSSNSVNAEGDSDDGSNSGSESDSRYG